MLEKITANVLAICFVVVLILGYHEFDCGYWRRKAETYVKEKYDYATVVADCVKDGGRIEYRAYDQYGDLICYGIVFTDELS